jgi:26S proteasome regulatory subunit T2
MGNN